MLGQEELSLGLTPLPPSLEAATSPYPAAPLVCPVWQSQGQIPEISGVRPGAQGEERPTLLQGEGVSRVQRVGEEHRLLSLKYQSSLGQVLLIPQPSQIG